MKLHIELTYEEIQNSVPYQIVAETMSSSIWRTGRRKRLMKEMFSKEEIERCDSLHRIARQWAFTKGVPYEGTVMSISTYELWQKLAYFCATLGG